MMMSSIGFDYGCESYDEHGKPEQLDAPADAFGAVVHVTGFAMRDRPPLPSHKEHWHNAWRAHPTRSDFAVRSSPMQMR